MGIRGYQKYNMVVASESEYSWGGADHTNMCISPDTSVPTGAGLNNYTNNVVSSSVTGATVTDSFIVPRVFDVLSIIDGTVYITLKFGATTERTASAPDYMEITKAEYEVCAVDSTGSSRTLLETQEVWTGSLLTAADGTNYLKTTQLIRWLDIEDATLHANERLLINVALTYNASLTATYKGYVRTYCTADTEETTITLPFVM